nr:LuxR family transcriptional regulator [Actinoplanes solisilvae]
MGKDVPVLRGRGHEQAALNGLLDAVAAGRSGALVLLGEAGMGKTALLDEVATAAARRMRVARVAGIESEMELPFAALHQLCGPLLDHLDRLPAPQRDALRTTFGLRAGVAPDPFFVGLAVLSLLAEAAAERPLLCVIDDAQWLDLASSQTLTFVARRLGAESILMLFAVREPAGDAVQHLRSLPGLPVGGLRDAEARELLASVVRWPLDQGVREAILAEARGNPLALLELPLRWSPVSLAGGFRLPRLTGCIQDSFQRRAEELSEPARTLLLLAAADPVGDSSLLWRAARLLGLGREAGDEVESAGLLQIGVRVVFRHTLVRSAVYGAASPEQRRRVHHALAEATFPTVDPDRQVWHRAYATDGADEAVAAALEASAGRAQARGGLAAAAAFLERAAELTADPMRGAERQLAAARAKYQAGAPEAASTLLARAEAGPPGEARAARVGLLRAQMAFASSRTPEAPGLLIAAARRLEPLDAGLAREAYLEAFAAAVLVGRFATDVGLAEVAAAALDAPPAPGEPGPPDRLLDGLAHLFSDGFDKGAPLVRQALAGFRDGDFTPGEALHLGYVVSHAAHAVWDDEVWQALTARNLRMARGTGALATMSYLLYQRLALHLHQGELAQAGALVDEVESVGVATGDVQPACAALAVAAWQGDEETVNRLVPLVGDGVTERREGSVFTVVHLSAAVLNNGLGRYTEARAAAERATAYRPETGFANWALVELVEAAALSGDRDGALAALDRLTSRTGPSDTDWGRGAEARSRALLTDGPEAERLFRSAIVILEGCRAAFLAARTHLLYGEWLHASGRTAAARVPLRTAYEMFRSFGAAAFAERARRELRDQVRGPATAVTPVELTPQERQIARRARDGQSNAEIGAELFLSARTVEWHLRKVFTKLGIANRRELKSALDSSISQG